MPWQECNLMDERLKFIAGLLDGEKMAVLCLRRATLYPAELRVRWVHPLADWPGDGNGSAGGGGVGQACAGPDCPGRCGL